jgi:two-component system chemotaxis response regulator CheB
MAPIRVMVVDDSVVARGYVRHWINSEPALELVASLCSGREAIDQVLSANPEVVVLDIEMPGLDGISTLPLLLEKNPDLAIIIASTLTRRNAELTLKALALGALDCIPKPDAAYPDSLAVFRRELTAKMLELGARRKTRRVAPHVPHEHFLHTLRAPVEAPTLVPSHASDGGIPLRPFGRIAPRVLLVGTSTGGPQALTGLMAGLSAVIDRAPILITQHMPPTFTTILAEHLARTSGRPANEAEDGEAVVAGRIYLAPGGRHMRLERRDGTAVIVLDNGPPVHHCKPAVDPMFSSAAEIWGSWVLGVVLTGMGSDGTEGARDIVAAGGNVIAQDEATSVVWGMPGSAAEAGLCAAVLPLEEIGPKITSLFAGVRA